MSTKAKISANGTYVFDAEEIERLDELSLTSVIAGAVALDVRDTSATQEAAARPEAGDTTINELLKEPAEPDVRSHDVMCPDVSGRGDEIGDLIDPDLIFTEPSRRR